MQAGWRMQAAQCGVCVARVVSVTQWYVQGCGGVRVQMGGRDCAPKPFFRAVCSVPLSGKTEGSGRRARLYCTTRGSSFEPTRSPVRPSVVEVGIADCRSPREPGTHPAHGHTRHRSANQRSPVRNNIYAKTLGPSRHSPWQRFENFKPCRKGSGGGGGV